MSPGKSGPVRGNDAEGGCLTVYVGHRRTRKDAHWQPPPNLQYKQDTSCYYRPPRLPSPLLLTLFRGLAHAAQPDEHQSQVEPIPNEVELDG